MNENIVNEIEIQETESVSTETNAYEPTLWEKFKNIFHIVRCVSCFTTLFASASLLLVMLDLEKLGNFGTTLIGICATIGWVSVLFACPWKIIKFCFSFTVSATIFGLGFAGIGCIVGFAVGMVVSMVVIFFIPAVISIPYFFNDLRY